MIELIISAFTNIQKLTPRILLGVSFSSGVLLFDEKYLIPLLKLENFVKLNQDSISLFFIISSGFLLAHMIWVVLAYFVDIIKNLVSKYKKINILKELTQQEKEYLSKYIIDLENSIDYTIVDGIAEGLIKKGILYRPSNHGIACNIEIWARKYLTKKKHLLD